VKTESINDIATHRATRQVNLRLERWQRRAVYFTLAWLFASGVLFLIARFFLRTSGEFGEVPHPWEHLSMSLHGGAAMATLFFLGSLMNSHIRRALKSGRNRYLGYAMVAVFIVLIATGYGLYYVAGESDRPLWSYVHWIVGLTFAPLFLGHLFIGRRSRVR
jgi:hypothetical protein